MHVVPEMGALADAIKESCFVVVATDNMDCFASAARANRQLATRFDDVICSSDVGLLKRDDPKKFFSAFLDKIAGSLDDSILVDDSAVNCETFAAAGGRAILHRQAESTRSELLSLLRARRSSATAVSEPFGPRTISPKNDANA